MNTSDGGTPLRFRLSGRRDREQDIFFEEALDSELWQPAEGDHWHTCWHTGMPEREAFQATSPTCTVNHIPGNNCLTIKSRLNRTLRALRDRVAATRDPDDEVVRRCEFVPSVYSMPEDYHALQAAAAAEPDKLWMLKPKNSARGRDIRLLDDVAEVPTESRWMVQEYLANPHLMDNRKYVLRLYALVSSIEPLRVYLYRQGFAKLASCAYSLDDRSNPYVHQTNPDVNARNEEAESPVVFIEFEQYRAWLREQGHDDETLFARIRDLVALTMIGAREPMRSATARFGADQRGCYEFIGLDCLVDADLNPWLLECNLSPSLGVCAAPDDGGVIEENVKRGMVADMVALTGLNDRARARVGAEGSSAEIAAEADAELARAGGFERVYPTAEPERYFPYFPYPRLADYRLASHVAGRPVDLPGVEPWQVAEIIADERLSLYAEAKGQLMTTNPMAALIWLHATNGTPTPQIAREVEVATASRPADASEPPANEVERAVWDALADWARDQMLVQTAPAKAGSTIAESTGHSDCEHASAVASRYSVALGPQPLTLNIWSEPAARRLDPLLRPLLYTRECPQGTQLDIVRSRKGFNVLSEGRIISNGLTLARLAPWLSDELLRRAPSAGEVAVPGALVDLPSTAESHSSRCTVLICREDAASDDRLALGCRQQNGCTVTGGARITVGGSGHASGLGLPLRDAGTDAINAIRAGKGPTLWTFGQNGTLYPSAPPPSDEGRAIDAVVIAGAANGTDDDPEIARIDVHKALASLVPQAVTVGGGILDRQACSQLASWLGERPLYRVAGDRSEAVLHELVPGEPAYTGSFSAS